MNQQTISAGEDVEKGESSSTVGGNADSCSHCKEQYRALAAVVQWIEHWPVSQRIVSSIPSQGTCLGCGPGPQLGTGEEQPHIDVSPPLFLPPFPSL